MHAKDVLKLVASLAICQLVGFAGSLVTRPAIGEWYAALKKPAFNPPNWIFAPMWLTLYVLMGVAAFLVWQRGWDAAEVRRALSLFAAQLLLNLLWSVLFFGLHSPLAALADIALLLALIASTLVLFWRLVPAAGMLFIPYLLWVGFAALLNAAIYWLNR